MSKKKLLARFVRLSEAADSAERAGSSKSAAVPPKPSDPPKTAESTMPVKTLLGETSIEPVKIKPSIEPAKIKLSIEPAKIKPSIEPDVITAAIDPTETTVSTELTETIASMKPGETIVFIEPAQRSVSIKPGETIVYIEPSETTASMESGETTVATEPGETTVATEPGETTVATEPGETTVSTDAAEKAESKEPPHKKAKVTKTIDNLIEDIVNCQKPLQPILSDDYLNPIPFTQFYVGQVKQVNELSTIILTLNQKIPLKEYGHLKRACRKEVLLFPTNYLTKHNHSAIQYYIEEHANELCNSFEYFKTLDVPAIAPKSKQQYVDCGRSWSCNFHPDKYLEKIFNAELFTKKELKNHKIFMGMAFEVARYYLSQENPNLKPSHILRGNCNATIVVDPLDQSVVAIAFDNRANHPIQHSSMLAIDNVAKTQTGGVWFGATDIYSDNLRGLGSMDLVLHLKKKYPSVKFGSKDYISKNELEAMNLSASECPYLCTQYYVYLIREPCLMCSMALVHARANRVFFFRRNDKGALVSKTKLHCVSSLNHRYEVFTGFM